MLIHCLSFEKPLLALMHIILLCFNCILINRITLKLYVCESINLAKATVTQWVNDRIKGWKERGRGGDLRSKF